MLFLHTAWFFIALSLDCTPPLRVRAYGLLGPFHASWLIIDLLFLIFLLKVITQAMRPHLGPVPCFCSPVMNPSPLLPFSGAIDWFPPQLLVAPSCGLRADMEAMKLARSVSPNGLR